MNAIVSSAERTKIGQIYTMILQISWDLNIFAADSDFYSILDAV